MRFPKIASMGRVFHLFDYEPLNRDGLNLKSRLKKFYFAGASNNNTRLSYNGVTIRQNDIPGPDPFHSSSLLNGEDASPYLAAGAKAIVDDVIGRFAHGLLKDVERNTHDGFDELMRYDNYSTRSYMAVAYRPSAHLNLPDEPLPADVINWLETFDKSTGWYDRALSETVLEAVAFGWNPTATISPMEMTEWYCIEYVSSIFDSVPASDIFVPAAAHPR